MPEPDDALPTFAALGVDARVVAALAESGIVTPTPVQAAVLPDALTGRDVTARARTGSGKTIAFGVPLLSRLADGRSRIHRPRALVVVPTRELATQVELALRPLARAQRLRVVAIYGGTSYDAQVAALRRATDVVVGTPGRLLDLLEQRALRVDDVAVTVLDEADELCDLGFHETVDRLLAATPTAGQRLLLSATLDGDVDRLVRDHLRDPARHEVDTAAVGTLSHHVVVVPGAGGRLEATYALAAAHRRTIVFTRTRHGATDLRRDLEARGLRVVDLHGDLPQHVRERNLRRFREGRAQVVVATDVAARGIHVDGVELVVHHDAPRDAKAYLHRSGRTARAGESGAVATLVVVRHLAPLLALYAEAEVEPRFHRWADWSGPATVAALEASGSHEPPPHPSKPGPSRGGRRRSASARAHPRPT